VWRTLETLGIIATGFHGDLLRGNNDERENEPKRLSAGDRVSGILGLGPWIINKYVLISM
jgi:hypothetical protein